MLLCVHSYVEKRAINVFLQGRATFKLCIPASVWFFSLGFFVKCVGVFFFKHKSVFVLTKLPLSSQWVTCCPPRTVPMSV